MKAAFLLNAPFCQKFIAFLGRADALGLDTVTQIPKLPFPNEAIHDRCLPIVVHRYEEAFLRISSTEQSA